jgi:hypothetical protein
LGSVQIATRPESVVLRGAGENHEINTPRLSGC